MPIHADILSFPRVPRMPQCTCWICGRWTAHTLTFILQPGAMIGESKRPLEEGDEVIVTVHLSVDTPPYAARPMREIQTKKSKKKGRGGGRLRQ